MSKSKLVDWKHLFEGAKEHTLEFFPSTVFEDTPEVQPPSANGPWNIQKKLVDWKHLFEGAEEHTLEFFPSRLSEDTSELQLPSGVFEEGVASTSTEYVAKAISMVHVDVDKVREVIKGTGDSELEHQHHAEQASVHFELQESVVQAEKSLDLARVASRGVVNLLQEMRGKKKEHLEKSKVNNEVHDVGVGVGRLVVPST
ncbi:hypothetical protein V6N13_052122 [Hibiscus sabdariffa]